MNHIYSILLLILLVIAFPIFKTESFRYQETLHQCWKQHTANTNLLHTDICVNPHKRLQFKDAGTVDCHKAERELLLSPTQCALKEWWKHTELVHLYDRIAGSYWSILGIVLPIILFILYLTSKHIRERQSEERFYDRQTKFIDSILPARRIEYEDEEEYDTSPMLEFSSRNKRK